ncbi:MAG TPA: hypothetical protein VGW38_22845 [Chloroflexota bacterium]|nr:hypothetical protein [Chloroflexota bacterium]
MVVMIAVRRWPTLATFSGAVLACRQQEASAKKRSALLTLRARRSEAAARDPGDRQHRTLRRGFSLQRAIPRNCELAALAGAALQAWLAPAE